jgi:hypothetical protein
MEIGSPLDEILGGSLTMVSTGASVCGRVLEACGFDVRTDLGIAPPAQKSSLADLVISPVAAPKQGL